ncbi:MAG TPA: hypothetical protein P5539_08890 [Mesotoga sp.]|nr:hypothetical protein [Mesotoga sp.]
MRSTREPINLEEVVSRVSARTGLSEAITAEVIGEFVGVIADSAIEFRPIKARGLFATNPSIYKSHFGPVLKVNFALGSNFKDKIKQLSPILRR